MNILELDQKALLAVHDFLIGRNVVLDTIIKILAEYSIYLVPVVLLILWFTVKKQREALFLAFINCMFSWFILTKLIISNIWFRPRPDLAILNIKEVIFHRPDYSFPSDHATTLFALTFALYLFGYKKAGHWFLALAILVSIARVAVGVHFPFDIVGGIISAGFGTVIIYLVKRPLLQYVYKPIVAILKKVRLA